MINNLGWKDLVNRRKGTHLTLFYKIVNHDVNISLLTSLKPRFHVSVAV